MLKSRFDAIMDQRSTKLLEHIGDWLPRAGSIVDVGSGTGHLSARLERELGVPVVPVDVTDLHVVGNAPLIIENGALPLGDDSQSAALLIFMLHYPPDPVAVLREAARVTRGPIILVQSLYSGGLGYLWLRAREFVWTYVAFHVSKMIGYVPRHARFSMNARRFYSPRTLAADLSAAGLRLREQRTRSVLPGNALSVAHLQLERVL